MFEIQNLSKVIFLSKAVSPACACSSILKGVFLEDRLFLIVYKKPISKQKPFKNSKENQMHLSTTLLF